MEEISVVVWLIVIVADATNSNILKREKDVGFC